MKKKYIKKILAASIVSLLFVQILYIFVIEPTVASAVVTATDDVLVTLNVTSGVSISNGADAPMDPDLGISANKSIGNSSWIVRTNSVSGYTLAVKANTAPALAVLADPTNRFFADYTEAAGVCSNGAHTTKVTCVGAEIWTPTPEQWLTAPGEKEFGYSAYGDNVPAKWGTGSGCGSAGVPLTTMNYAGFTMTNNDIASSNTVTTTTGTTTNICFAAEQNTVFAPSGTYNATITATASAI